MQFRPNKFSFHLQIPASRYDPNSKVDQAMLNAYNGKQLPGNVRMRIIDENKQYIPVSDESFKR